MKFKLRPEPALVKLAAVSVLLAWLIAVAVLASRPGHELELRVYDWLSVVTAPERSSLPITIIGIDEASSQKIGQPWPWPRDVHAKLVDRLAKANVAVIAFDVVFSPDGSPQGDRQFAEAIRKAGNVVLASDTVYEETPTVRQWRRVEPPPVLAAGAATGVRTVVLDEDAVVRRVPDQPDAFWRQVIATLARARPDIVSEPRVHAEELVRHLGPARTFPYIPYHLVLNGDAAVPDNFLANQLVLIGRDVPATTTGNSSAGDTYNTPFLRTSRTLTPAVELQATLIENALMGRMISPASTVHNLLVVSATLLLASVALVFWHPVRSALLLIVLGLAVLGVSAGLFVGPGVWQFSALPVLALVLALGFMAAGAYWREGRRLGELRSAFNKYVSADLVDQIIANPERVKLGGQSVELTVLFCDLASFTSVCERLPPQGVADVINLYANEMTQAIMKHGGTVDKFIGDAVMAFWGAPLSDPEHALHAVRAAVDMQAAMDRLQPKLMAMGAKELGLRIGLSSGPAIVGNMGSSLRFEYTALGDTVNLAARLEAANKIYGTGILFSGSTAALLDDAVAFRRVDRVRVKGKQVAVDIFTPCDDIRLVRASELAWSAYEQGNWQAAAACWAEVRAIDPHDSIAAVFVSRLAHLHEQQPSREWDAATALEKG
jgi:adenylate cyclase